MGPQGLVHTPHARNPEKYPANTSADSIALSAAVVAYTYRVFDY